MNKKVLFCATTKSHIGQFHGPYIKYLKELGCEVHVAANDNSKDIPVLLEDVDKYFNIPFSRSPISKNNIKSYLELSKLIKTNKYSIIHSHTPMGGVLARLANFRNRKKNNTISIYTAHGFHFYKNAPLKNWLIYYPIEKVLSIITDCLITITEEDYQTALKRNFKAKNIKHVYGVGVDTRNFKPIQENEKSQLRIKKGYDEKDFLLFYAAGLEDNKNQEVLIEAIYEIKTFIPNIKLLLAGTGPNKEKYQKMIINLGLERKVLLLGHINDVKEILPIVDLVVASSLREGLPLNIMEAMACGKPVIASKNRGHSELIKNGINGYIINSQNSVDFAEKIRLLYDKPDLRLELGLKNLQVIEEYSLSNVIHQMKEVYDLYI